MNNLLIKQKEKEGYFKYLKRVINEVIKIEAGVIKNPLPDCEKLEDILLYLGLSENQYLFKQYTVDELVEVAHFICYNNTTLESVLDFENVPGSVKLWALHMLFNKVQKNDIWEIGFSNYFEKFLDFINKKGYSQLAVYAWD